jgi:dTDP-glucose pyrophosphorylase
LTAREAAAVLAVKEEHNPEAIKRNFAVVLNEAGEVRRVIEKPRYIRNKLKGCGLYLFDLPIFDAIRRTPRTAMRNEYEITDAIQILIDDGYRVTAADVIREDVNVSFPHDLLQCNLMQLRKRKLSRLLGATAHIASEATIEGSIVGEHVSIDHGISIRHSLIFEGSHVEAHADLDRAIVTPGLLIDCRHEAQLASLVAGA